MARIRSLKIGFFQNEDLASLTPVHRLLFAGLWLLADREGRLEDRPKRIEAELFPYEAVEVPRLLHGLAVKRLILRYERDGGRFILIPGFLKHQRPHPKEQQSLIPEPLNTKVCAKPCNSTALPDLPTAEPHLNTALPGGSGDLGLGDLGIDQDQRETRDLFIPEQRLAKETQLVALCVAVLHQFPDYQDPDQRDECKIALAKAHLAYDPPSLHRAFDRAQAIWRKTKAPVAS